MKKALVVLMGVALTVAGCGSNTSSEAPKQQETPKNVTLKIFNSKTEIVEQLNALKKDYESEHPGVTLQIDTVIGTDYGTALKAKYAGNETPDLFVNTGDTDRDIWIDNLEDLSDQPWVNDVIDIAKPSISKDGKLYGMPMSLEGYGFIYNKDLFAKAGITDIPTTLTSLKADVQKLKDAGIPPFSTSYQAWVIPGRFGVNNAIAKQQDPYQFMNGLNNGSAKIVGNPIFSDYLNLVDLEINNSFKPPLTTDYNTQVTQFANSEVAMIHNGNWIQPMLDKLNPKFHMGIMPMPINDNAALNDKIFVGVPNYWVINKKSPVKAEAKQFLNWLVSSDKGKKYITQQFKFVPAFKSIQADPATVGDLGGDVQKYVKENKIYGWYWPKYPTGVMQEFGAALQKLAGGKSNRDQVLVDMQSSWDKQKSK